MGFASYAEISYGVKFGNGYEFPWDKEEFNNDIIEWWFKEVLKVTQYSRIFYESNLPPVKLVQYAHSDCFILAIPSTVIQCEDCFPYHFKSNDLTFSEEQQLSLIDFIEKYITEKHQTPKWWLSTYYA